MVLKKDEGKRAASFYHMEEAKNVNKQPKKNKKKTQPLVIHCLLQATPFHLCHCEKEIGREEGGRRKSLPPGPLLVFVC